MWIASLFRLHPLAGSAGLAVIDVTNPSLPVEVSVSPTPGWAMGVEAGGNALYIADALGGVLVMNISSPARPAALGSIQFLGGDSQEPGSFVLLATALSLCPMRRFASRRA